MGFGRRRGAVSEEEEAAVAARGDAAAENTMSLWGSIEAYGIGEYETTRWNRGGGG